MRWQDRFSLLPDAISEIEKSLSVPRFQRYVRETNGNRNDAAKLYHWNIAASQSLYFPLQMLEISARNGIARALTDKFGSNWHLDGRFLKSLHKHHSDTLAKAVMKTKQTQPSVNVLISELTFGFWCSLLAKRYHVPIGWASRLSLAFPNLPASETRPVIEQYLSDARLLRNRISHHEPIITLRLQDKHQTIMRLLEWLSPATHWYTGLHCTFQDVWDRHPVPALRR